MTGRSAKSRSGDARMARHAIRFSAKLHRPAEPGKPASWAFLAVPQRASARLPSRGMVSIAGTINGAPLKATLQPDGKGGHWLKVDGTLRKAAGAEIGDTVTLEFAPVAEEPEPEVPPDLQRALAAAPSKARDAWSSITPVARRDWIHWITSGKRAETRRLRIEKACDMLANGKRRPCCFDRSGMYDKSLSCPEPLID